MCVCVCVCVCVWEREREREREIVKSQTARISQTLSLHPSLSSIALVRSTKLHPVSAQSWCKEVLSDRLTLARSSIGVQRKMSLMSPCLILQECSACHVSLTGMVFEMWVSGRIAAVLWGVASRICSKQHVAFLRRSHLVFSSSVLLTSMCCIYTVVLTQRQLGKNVLFCRKMLLFFDVINFKYIYPVLLVFLKSKHLHWRRLSSLHA